MTYKAGESLILNRVQNLTSFSTENCSQGNWKILNSGKSDHYAILRPGPFERLPITITSIQSNWTTVVEVWQRYQSDSETLTDLQALITEVIDEIDEYRLLADTEKVVQDAVVRSAGDVLEVGPTDGAPQWLKWELIIDWKEEAEVTYAE